MSPSILAKEEARSLLSPEEKAPDGAAHRQVLKVCRLVPRPPGVRCPDPADIHQSGSQQQVPSKRRAWHLGASQRATVVASSASRLTIWTALRPKSDLRCLLEPETLPASRSVATRPGLKRWTPTMLPSTSLARDLER